ncbi:RICIN domain-containing protein [Amycolatopsis magusensis]|uniref:XRE family transcriptional regulator n=1 Tax=Amycolatopsis magusensis TaxID=882444 RepID=A0ABS4PTC5_9PSEU|nr:RICIN domain-containing protein [Amycolatopsis magusensis]MBP2182684.1 hypothetical protein [Amycolatopsis magusensis]
MTGDHPRPGSARDAAEFTASLRLLKRRSGRTLRQLEEQAAQRGAVLPRSTVADMLNRGVLPRPELLAAFVQACGDGQHLAEWLSTRERLAVNPYLDPEEATPAAGTEADAGAEQSPRRRVWAVAGLVVAAVAVVVVALVMTTWWPRTGPPDPDADAPPRREILALSSAGSWIRLQSAGAPELCLTEGRERTGRYDSAVAVLRSCGEPGGPRVFLQPVGTDRTTIKWEHPVTRIMGCLTVVDTEVIKGMLEPQENCVDGNEDQLFHIERAGEQSYRLRTPGSDLCVGLRDDLIAIDAEAIREPCAAEKDQEFLFDIEAGAGS